MIIVPNAELILPDIDFIVHKNIDLSGIVLTHAFTKII